MKDVMIDLETLGTKVKAPVISIGAQTFDLENFSLGSSFYAVLELQPQFNAGRVPDADTLSWWMSQPEQARAVFDKKRAVDVATVLTKFTEWLPKNCVVWGNGASFDISILESLYEDFHLTIPWKYNKIMDLRTFKRFFNPEGRIEGVGVKHNALDDAKSQAIFAIETYRKAKK